MGKFGTKKAGAFKKLGRSTDLSVVKTAAKNLAPSPKVGQKDRPIGFGG